MTSFILHKSQLIDTNDTNAFKCYEKTFNSETQYNNSEYSYGIQYVYPNKINYPSIKTKIDIRAPIRQIKLLTWTINNANFTNEW